MDIFRQLSTQFSQLWSRMSAGMRTLVAVTVMASIAAVLGVGWWSQQTDYQPVYTGLALEDIGAMTSKLAAQGIPYRLAGAGTTLLVPSDQVQQVRVAMAVEGLPAKGGGRGYEGVENNPILTTPSATRLQQLRAEQVELARSIMQIDPVVYARVHISRSDPTPFIRDAKPTTASVVLRLRANTSLSRNVGAAIAAYVVHSVEGLSKENVTLIDTNARILFQETTSEEGQMNSQLDYRRDLESYLASKAEGMLASVLGPGKANVRVNADVNLKSNRERKETLLPVLGSESITETKTINNEGSKSGVAGASSNLGKTSIGGSSKETNAISSTTETKYVQSKTVHESDDKMGAVQRLTIAAFVELPPPTKDGDNLDLAKVKEIIKNAVGFKTDRDEITVTQMKFAEPKLPVIEPETPPTPAWVNWLDVTRNASIAMAALVTCVLGIAMVRRGAPKKDAAAAAKSLEESGDILRFQKLTQALEKNPEALAKVLDNWLKPPANPPANPPAAAA